MRQFISFVHKEFLHIFRDSRSMLILLVYPVILIILFGYAVTTEVKNVRVAVFDTSRDELTAKICERITASRYLTLERYVDNKRQLDAAFRRGDIDVAVVTQSGFVADMIHSGTAAIQVVADATEPNQAAVRVQYVKRVLYDALQDINRGSNFEGKREIIPVTRMLYNPQLKSEYNFVPGVIGMILMLICAMMSSIAIVREKETGTMEVLLASPLSPACIIVAKLVPYFVISGVNLAVILLLSSCLLQIPMAGSLLCLLGITLLYILVALTLGLFISTLVNTQMAAMVLSLLLIIPTMYLSGLAFPLDSMPVVLQKISAVVPARWFIDAARKLMIQGVDAATVAFDAAVLVVMEALLLVVSLKLFKTRLQ